MIQINELSRIGFGAYRAAIDNEENESALRLAIQCGCNLIDTAAGYGNGNSEKLIGRVLQDIQDEKIFVITKAGYIGSSDLHLLQNLNRSGKGLSDLVNLPGNFKHSIHPDYLEAQIAISLQRLHRKYIDGFLLHSPEYYFDQKNMSADTGEYYRRIGKAFEFLEEKVKKGMIRYYGVSSNTLPLSGNANATDLAELLKISSRVSGAHHFRLVQFPFNIIERGAGEPSPITKKSLIELAKEHGIATFSNRPLNANSGAGALRLVIHDPGKLELNSAADGNVHDRCFAIIEEQLKRSGGGSDISEFPMVAYLKDNWTGIPHEGAFKSLFYRSFYPFIASLFNNDTPKEAMSAFREFEAIAWKYHLRTASARAIAWMESNNLKRLLPTASSQSLPANLCKEYLRLGIDHVLVGMRKPQYVNELKHLFPPPER